MQVMLSRADRRLLTGVAPDGSFAVDRVRPGRHELFLQCREDGTTWGMYVAAFTVPPDGDFDLPAIAPLTMGAVELLLPSAAPRAVVVAVRDVRGAELSAPTLVPGRPVRLRLPAGRYSLVYGVARGTMCTRDFDVAADASIRVELEHERGSPCRIEVRPEQPATCVATLRGYLRGDPATPAMPLLLQRSRDLSAWWTEVDLVPGCYAFTAQLGSKSAAGMLIVGDGAAVVTFPFALR